MMPPYQSHPISAIQPPPASLPYFAASGNSRSSPPAGTPGYPPQSQQQQSAYPSYPQGPPSNAPLSSNAPYSSDGMMQSNMASSPLPPNQRGPPGAGGGLVPQQRPPLNPSMSGGGGMPGRFASPPGPPAASDGSQYGPQFGGGPPASMPSAMHPFSPSLGDGGAPAGASSMPPQQSSHMMMGTSAQPSFAPPMGAPSAGFPGRSAGAPFGGPALREGPPPGPGFMAPPTHRAGGYGDMTTAAAPIDPTGAQASGLAAAAAMSASPEFCQSTLGRAPSSASLKQKSHIPFAVTFRALAPSAAEVPSVNFGSNGKVVRCDRCRTYINPFATWEAGGRRWICNICASANECRAQYFCPADDKGRRTDRQQRPELCQGSVEFVAPGDYMVRPPQPPTYLFVIDVSASAVASGLLSSVCVAIKTAIATGQVPGGTRTQLGIVTFDTSIHFYRLDPSLSQAQMVVVPDLTDVFLPLSEGCLVNLSESTTVIENLLDSLPLMWSSQRITESCLGSAIKAAHLAIKHIGGKMMVFVSTLPTVGDLTLGSKRGEGRAVSSGASSGGANRGDGREAEALKPADEGYMQLAAPITQSQVAVSLYVCPPGSSQQPPYPLDLATLAPLSQKSSGDVSYFHGFNLMGTGDKLRQELVHALTRETGWEAVMRIRVSRGWKIVQYFGNHFVRHSDLLVLPSCHSDQACTVMLDLEDTVAPDPFCQIQSALLYTNSNGERRIRVHTLCLPVTQHFGELMASMNEQAVVSTLAKQAISLSVKTNPTDGRQFLQTSCSQILASLGQAHASAAYPTFALSVLGLLKSVAFRDVKEVTPDLRVYHWTRLTACPIDVCSPYCYPRLIALHNLTPPMGAASEDGSEVVLPPQLNLSASSLTQDGAFLLEDGEAMLLWVGRGINPGWLQAVFGVDNIDHVNPEHADAVIGSTGTDMGSRVASVIAAVREQRLPYMKLTVIRQGAPLEYRFFCSLIEDRSHALMLSYPEFIQKVGRVGGTWSAYK